MPQFGNPGTMGGLGNVDANSLNLNTNIPSSGTMFNDIANPNNFNMNMGVYGMYPGQSNMNN